MSKKKQVQPKRAPLDINHIFFSLILIAYGFVTVLTPNLRTLDSNGPKFMSIAILNIVVFLFLFLRKDQKYARWAFGGFFRNPVAIAYSLLMVVSLLSFTVAININESILHFAKIFTVFSAAWMVATIIYHDNKSFRYLAIAMSALLVFDSITVFQEIVKYVNGEVASIALIKSVYSNKNILASSIFVKIPFAFWLLLYEKKWGKVTGSIVILLSLVATLFLSTRAFYVGTAFLSLAILLFLGIRFRQQGKSLQLSAKSLVLYLIILVAGLVIYSLVQKLAFPKNKEVYDKGVLSRVTSISGTDGGGGRLRAWKRSFNLIKENPMLGIGLGNWKVVVLKQENLTSPNYIYFYKNHNDFIETTAESGIFGGIFFLAIFVLVFLNLVREMKKKADDERLKFAFIPALGLFCYAFDAFFNFPQDRPEIQALFALYTGAAIAFSFKRDDREDIAGKNNGQNILAGKWMIRLFTVVLAAVLVASCYLLIWNFNSLKLQRLIKEEMNRGVLKLPASKFLSEFPPIPDINVVGEPIAVQKARYLLNEKRYKETVDLLKADNSSPFDMRKELFMSKAYNDMGQLDSAMVYARKVYAQKPRLFDNVVLMAVLYERQNKFKETAALWQSFLSHTKDNNRAWAYAAGSYDRSGNIGRAYAVIDSALLFMPNDTLIQKNHRGLFQRFKIEPYKELYQSAINEFKAKNYPKAMTLFDAFVEKVPDFYTAYEMRAFCYFFGKSYEKSIEDINNIVKYGGTLKGNIINLRGVNYQTLGKKAEACADYERAMKMGDKDGTSNYTKFCQTKSQTATQVTNTTPIKVFNK